MKKTMLIKFKKVVVTTLIACMLFTMFGVNSNANSGVVPCGGVISTDERESN